MEENSEFQYSLIILNSSETLETSFLKYLKERAINLLIHTFSTRTFPSILELIPITEIAILITLGRLKSLLCSSLKPPKIC